MGALILPHPNTLQAVKNSQPQKPGIHDEQLQWMKDEADRLKLSVEQRRGGVMFDEMSIQVNIK